MIPSQMLKGTLEGCILTVIGQGEVYGYHRNWSGMVSVKLRRGRFIRFCCASKKMVVCRHSTGNQRWDPGENIIL